MKYIALIHNSPEAWKALTEAERDRFSSDADVFLKNVTESGELAVGAVVLAHPSNTKTVRVRDGVPTVTDGPFAESKELIAGFTIVDVPTLDDAMKLAERFAACFEGEVDDLEIDLRRVAEFSDFQ